jgi:acyl-CoA synthetase (AMP-forming)/AMP-acid ligase II
MAPGKLLKTALLRTLRYPHRLLPGALAQHGAAPACEDGTTFPELLDRARRLAGHWRDQGLIHQDRVVIDLPNSRAFLEARLAAILAGLVAVPVPRGSTAARLGQIAELAAARGYLGTRAETLPGLHTALPVCPRSGDTDRYEQALRRARPLRHPPRIRGKDLLTVNFTSGSTGTPKGVMSTVAGWGWSLYFALAENRVPVERGEVFLHALPLSTAGSSLLLPAVLSGAKSVFLEDWDAATAADLVEAFGVTRLFLTPTQLAGFVDAARSRPDRVGTLKAVIYGTEGIPANRIKKAFGVLGPVLQQGYGMAEALPPVAILHQSEHALAIQSGDDELLASAGRPTRAVQLLIGGPDGTAAGPGEPGEILLRGRTLSPGYWRDPALTRATRTGGFYRTGDEGHIDRRGYLHVAGRRGAAPSATAKEWTEWAESQATVQLAWVDGSSANPTLCVVPSRHAAGRSAHLAEELRRAFPGPDAPALEVFPNAPMSGSYKLRYAVEPTGADAPSASPSSLTGGTDD